MEQVQVLALLKNAEVFAQSHITKTLPEDLRILDHALVLEQK